MRDFVPEETTRNLYPSVVVMQRNSVDISPFSSPNNICSKKEEIQVDDINSINDIIMTHHINVIKHDDDPHNLDIDITTDEINVMYLKTTPKLEDFLLESKTPERKNKTHTEKTSFVKSSTVYKEQLEEKQKVKQENERTKEENKQKRLLKKSGKENKQINKTTPRDKTEDHISTHNNIEQKSGLCITCVKNITSRNLGIKCQHCTRVTT